MKSFLNFVQSLIAFSFCIACSYAIGGTTEEGIGYGLFMNIMTHSVTFKKENVSEFFTDPLFLADDIRDQITVRTDIKGTEKINRITRPSKITRKKLVAGFTPIGTMTLTQTEITVQPVAIEFEQNGREFLDSVLELALAKGWAEDDVEQMSGPAFWNEIVLPIIAEAGKDDLIRQMWFNDTTKEVLTGGFITGPGDVDYDPYTGFWTNFFADVKSGAIPAAQRITIANGAVKQELIETLSGITAGSITLTVNGTAYVEPFDTDATTTAANWVTSFAAIILARGQLTGVTVTTPSAAAIKFVAADPGQGFTVVETDAGTGGSWALSGVVANVAHAALDPDEADTTFNAMIDAMTPEQQQFNSSFIVTRTMWRNYVQTLKALGTELAHTTTINGQTVMTYEGMPIWVRPEWDQFITADHNSVYPHRAVLTPRENLWFATDGAQDIDSIQTWYNEEAQQRRYRVQYKGQTLALHNQLVVVAF